MKNILLYQHGGSKNHGCEALARTVTNILKQKSDVSITLCSNNPEEDVLYGLNNEMTILKNNQIMKRYSPKWFIYHADKRITKSNKIQETFLTEKDVINASKNCQLAVAVGGDNYCYNKGRQFWPTDRKLKKDGLKTLLWGCSIEPNDIDKEFADHLSNFDVILARESISYNALKNAQLHNTTLALVPDPAFTLIPDVSPLPNGFLKNTVGINVSPMIINCEQNSGATLANYVALIEYILKETDLNIALIPHVVWSYNDDRQPLKMLYDKFEKSGRICLIEDCNCCQIKGYISQLKMFIGARTHSTIAAYSTCVPTLVVGYSVKAKGIAVDLFGTDEDYVLPVQSLNKSNELVDAFKKLYDSEDKIRMHLKEIMPSYIQSAYNAGNYAMSLEKNL